MRVIGSGMAGRVTRAALEACPGYEPLAAHSYSPDPAALAAIRRSAGGIQILVFVGIWCPDCKRELPRFLRVADEAGLAASQITLCVVDRLKRDPEGLADHRAAGRNARGRHRADTPEPLIIALREPLPPTGTLIARQTHSIEPKAHS